MTVIDAQIPVKPSDAATATTSRPALGLSTMAWISDGEMDHPAWLAEGRRIGALGRCSQWWVGDWVRYGTARWGERYVEAAKITGFDPKSLRNMVYVASRFELSRRRDNLSYSHHAELAVLEPDEQDRWLDFAIARRLSVADLRLELRSSARSSTGPGDLDDNSVEPSDESTSRTDTLVCPSCGHTIPLPSEARTL